MVADYGPKETATSLVSVLRKFADNYSDAGLKELAVEYSEIAEKLEKAIQE